VASRVTYLLEPKNWLIVTVIAIGAHADGLAGAGWGVLAAFFAAVLPTVFIDYGIRRGHFDDRNVGARRPRLVVLAFITASVATGLILLLVLGAPAMLTGYLAFMLISVAVLAAITMVWKISIHCAVASGSVTILALAYGPLVLAGYLLVGLLGWSRVAVRDHTIWQVVGGAVLGAAAAALAFTAFLPGLSGRRGPPLAAISPARRPQLSRPARSARLPAPAQRRTTGPGRIAPRRPSRPRRAGAPRARRVRAARPRRAR
jgi:MFS family permease